MTVNSPPVFYTPRHLAHDPDSNHADQPARAELLLSAALGYGLVAHEPQDWGMSPIGAVHSSGLLAFMQTAYRRFAQLPEGARPAVPDGFAVRELGNYLPRNIWGQLGHYCTDNLTPILEDTWTAAYWAAQTALSAAAAVADGATLGYGLCRPPGHHAYNDLYGGYCYLNNAAIAAQWLVERGHRPAILDIDYHHGNGTQAIFYERPDVFFCSIHADPEDEYPYYCGFAHETGSGLGEGFTLNLPLPLDTGPQAYLHAVARSLAAVDAFAPDVLVLSLGFDIIAGDPHGGLRLGPETFADIGRALAELRRPLLLIQEGGYLLPALGPALTALLAGING